MVNPYLKNPKSIFRGFLSDYFLCQDMYVIYFLNSHFSKKVKGFIVKHTCLIFNLYGVHSGACTPGLTKSSTS